MRSWKKAETPAQAVFLYFRAHPDTLFSPEHVAAQLEIGERRVRRIISALESLGKVVGFRAQTSNDWGRHRLLFQAVRTSDDSLAQMEIQADPGPAASLVYSAFQKV